MRKLIIALLIFFGFIRTGDARGLIDELKAHIETSLPDLVHQYQWFHQHPELSGKEVETAKKLASYLRNLGLEVHEKVGGNGVIGILRGPSAGPLVLYRTDMDALPIVEETKLHYSSVNNGVMHACGHDMHMTNALGALKVLAKMRNRWQGTVLFVGQPAEETGEGARTLLKDKKFRAILKRLGKPKIALAMHVTDADPSGTILLVPGPISSNLDDVDIVIHGKGGHGARPQVAIDPIVIGADMVMTFQTIISRRIAPGQRAVISVGKFVGGTLHNIIPDTAALALTVRSFEAPVQRRLLAEIRRTAIHVALAHGAKRKPEIKISKNYCPAVVNDQSATEKLFNNFAYVLGGNHVLTYTPGMGGEDFSFFAKILKIPILMWKLGTVDSQTLSTTPVDKLPNLHSSKWFPDVKPTLRAGVLSAAVAMLTFLDVEVK